MFESTRSIPNQYGRLVSFSRRVAPVNVLHLLPHLRGVERFYWENRRTGFTLLGFGVATELMAWGEQRFQTIEHHARQLFDGAFVQHTDPVGKEFAMPRLFGGFAFRDDFTPDNTWAVFNPAHFILPHYQLVQTPKGAWLTVNVHVLPDENPETIIPELQEALNARWQYLKQLLSEDSPSIHQPPLRDIHYPMAFEAWEQAIEEAVRAIRAGQLEKVVLARVAEALFEDAINIEAALAYLADTYPDCYRFLFEPRPNHAFYGATPELLVSTDGDTAHTMGLAGSRKRGQTASEDEQLADDLFQDPKERHEHNLVVQAIQQRLNALATQLDIPATPQILKLSNIQHLYTPIKAHGLKTNGVLPLVESLHPTPALGGTPRAEAMKFIRNAELVPRGWYAAPIGWIDYRMQGAFAVAIRSAVVQEKRVWMYAGAGIVGDSVAQKEWDETALKFRPMMDALHIREQVDA